MYMFGGQNLQPYKEQIQYDDMWILSVPSFTWIQVNADSVPPARAGHTCNIWDGQMVVVGGYVGQDLSCDAPGIYVFNTSSLTWENQFTALTGSGSQDSNPFSQQTAQRTLEKDNNNQGLGGLEGSYGYQVPAAVISVIGGSPTGGATVTAPIQTPTGGPLATGKPITYTVTGPGGSVVTETGAAAGGAAGSDSGSNNGNIIAIIVGVIAGVFAIIAAYFAFCTWLYRKQLKLYKNHELMTQRAAVNAEASRAEKEAFLGAAAGSSGKNSHERHSRTDSHGSTGVFADTAGRGQSGEASRPARRASDASSTDDLLMGQEPSFWGVRGVLLNPRRSLRVINRD